MGNLAILAQLALQAAQGVAAYQGVIATATAEGRDATDAEVAAARAAAVGQVDALDKL